AFENAIVLNSAIGGSTNAPIHLNAVARHLGIELTNDDWQAFGHRIPLLVNLQPAGEYLGEDYHRAGGVPAVVGELIRNGLLPNPQAITANGSSIGDNCREVEIANGDVIWSVDSPMKAEAGFINLSGNLFDSAIMKTSVISPSFSERFLSNPDDPNAFEGTAYVFDGPVDFHERIDDEALGMDGTAILVMRGAGPIGYPGGAEVVNMRPPAYLIKQGIDELPCIGDGRQSGTSGSPSILNASPEAADGGGLALIKTGDRVRVDLNKCTVDMMVPEAELASRAEALAGDGGFAMPESQSPWQQIFRERVRPFAEGMVLDGATDFQSIVRTRGLPRDNH
ncbi:MAG: dihydroxy-acid dehydratase, partial [Pseudomonadota bacterium]|nr:dihydroxy-acid dehydratase [Pseudomonadota bacterium]